jgi:hypothetical protein
MIAGVSPRRPGEKPVSPGGYVTPWRVRLLIVVAVIAVLLPVGLAPWSVPAAIVLLVSAEVYWRRRENG